MSSVIFATYDIFMLRDNLIKLINGGQIDNYFFSGLSNKNQPVNLGYTYIPYRLFFASENEDECFAFVENFIEEDPFFYTLVRLWKIEEEQFIEIQKFLPPHYNLVLNLGKKEKLPIKTYTTSNPISHLSPSKKYLNQLIDGISETTGWNYQKSLSYITKFFD